MFNFQEDFQRYENNPKFQKPIERIIKSNFPLISFEWINNKKEQKKGIDLKININGQILNIDQKLVTYKENHHYLDDISIELVSDYHRFIQSEGKEGISWLFKKDSKTDYLLYFWLDEYENVRLTIVLISYKGLRKWAKNLFGFFELFPFLEEQYKSITSQKYDTLKLSNFKIFEIFSHKNIIRETNSKYFTITAKMNLKYLNKEFNHYKHHNLGKIILLSEQKPLNTLESKQEIILKDFF